MTPRQCSDLLTKRAQTQRAGHESENNLITTSVSLNGIKREPLTKGVPGQNELHRPKQD